MELFRGYVPTENKKCIVAFKGKKNLHTIEQVKNLSEYAGILADNTVLIDIDDMEQSDILFDIVQDYKLKCRVYETSRGKHFLFLNDGTNERNKTHATIACGLYADIKLGTRNSYEVLKYDGKERKILYDTNEYETVPKFLLPVKTNVDFLNLENGDGRNQTLFNYILTLQSYNFSNDEARECIKIINDYVLLDPLEDRELDTVLRDEAFMKPSFIVNGKMQYDKFSNYLKNTHNIKKIYGQLHIYRDGIYSAEQRYIEKAMLDVIPNLTRAKRSECLSYLDVSIDDSEEVLNNNLIAFKNGIYDITTGEIQPFSPAHFIVNKINYNYNENAYHELTDKTLDKLACNDKSVRALLEEAVGYCFFRQNELRKAFILTGDKKNGKSTYLAMVKQLLGDENTVALDLSEVGDRFSTVSLFGKLANIGDDIGDNFISNTAVFKKIVSGDWIKGERKGQNEFFFKPYCKLLFSANEIPRMKDKSGAVLDRLVIIPFDAHFSKNDPDFDPYIKYKLLQPEALEYLIKVGVEGLKRVLNNQGFTESAKVKKSIQEYEEHNNPILLFFKELEKVENEPTGAIYQQYVEFCIANTFTPISKISFSKAIKKQFNVEVVNTTINGKQYRKFVKV